MFKKIALLPLLLISTSAQAQEWVDGFYAEVYGGATFATEVDRYLAGGGLVTFDLDGGGLLGASVGVETGVEGLAFELDVLRSSAMFATNDQRLSAIAVMGNAQYTATVADQFGIYGGAGLGAIFMHYEHVASGIHADGTGFGYQAFAGLIYDVTDNVSIFGEYRYQATFENIALTIPPVNLNLNYHRHAVMAGIRVSR